MRARHLLRRCRIRGIRSLRGKLTLVNVALLAAGIVVATAVSLMTARFYLLDKVDTELKSARGTLSQAGFTLRQIESQADALAGGDFTPREPVQGGGEEIAGISAATLNCDSASTLSIVIPSHS